MQFPLEVGKKYKARFDYTNDNRTGYDDLTIEVKSFEKIKVAAGEFDAFKLEIKGWWNCTIGCQGSGRIERYIWWAPSVKREVKTTAKSWTAGSRLWDNSERELISWEPSAAVPIAFSAKPTAAVENAAPAAAK